MKELLSFRYVWIKTWVILLHSIAPLCITYTALHLLLPPSIRLPTLFEYWADLETVFCAFTHVYQRWYLERPAFHPTLPSQDERSQLFDLCQNSVLDHRQYISRWFLGVPLASIKRGNVQEFFRWAFLNTAADDPVDNKEVDGYVKKLEDRIGAPFEPGYADTKCLRLTLDKVGALHRSLIWYTAILVVDITTHGFMTFYGYQFYRPSLLRCTTVFPPRLQTVFASQTSAAKDLGYWYTPHTSRKHLPVVFLHDIGVGLYPYMQFLDQLKQSSPEENGNIGVLAVEILPVSSRIAPPLLRKGEMCRQLHKLLQYHGIEKFVLVSHSFGSVITTHLLKTPSIAKHISSVILVDPISILLHEPDVAYNFTVRRPHSANEWLYWYFGSKDMGTAYTLSRQFFWYENILWKEDLASYNATVFLSGHDSIVNSPRVRAYLNADAVDGKSIQDNKPHKNSNAPSVTETRGCGEEQKSLKVVWCADLDHGQVFDLRSWRARLTEEILIHARSGESII